MRRFHVDLPAPLVASMYWVFAKTSIFSVLFSMWFSSSVAFKFNAGFTRHRNEAEMRCLRHRRWDIFWLLTNATDWFYFIVFCQRIAIFIVFCIQFSNDESKAIGNDARAHANFLIFFLIEEFKEMSIEERPKCSICLNKRDDWKLVRAWANAAHDRKNFNSVSRLEIVAIQFRSAEREKINRSWNVMRENE